MRIREPNGGKENIGGENGNTNGGIKGKGNRRFTIIIKKGREMKGERGGGQYDRILILLEYSPAPSRVYMALLISSSPPPQKLFHCQSSFPHFLYIL